MKQLTISEFIKKAVSEIEAGLPSDYSLDGAIEFEISVITTESNSGGIDLKVVSGDLSNETEIVQTITFPIINKIQKDKEGKRAVKYFVKGMKQLSKLGKEIEEK